MMLIVAVVIGLLFHELGHVAAAWACGDETARDCGRWTLNPLAHADFVGSFVLPAVSYLIFGHHVVGFGKAVPVSPKLPAAQRAAIYLAGPLTNVALAVAALPSLWWEPAQVWVHTQIMLAVFNLLPLPGLDGGRIIGALFEGARAA